MPNIDPQIENNTKTVANVVGAGHVPALNFVMIKKCFLYTKINLLADTRPASTFSIFTNLYKFAKILI